MNTSAYHTDDKSVESCADRATKDLGSSFNMPVMPGKGIFSGTPAGSNFYDWNRVVVRYCDGGSFSGDADKPDPVYSLSML